MTRFIKFIPGEKATYLRQNHPSAFLLLNLIAERARRTPNHIDGLLVGDAMLGDHKLAGLTRQQYRTALEKLTDLNMIEIVHNGKKFLKREKSTIKLTIVGMLVNLKDSSIWDINSEEINQHINQRATNEQPTSNHKEERKRKKKKEKEEDTHMEIQKVVGGCDTIISFNGFTRSDNECKKPQFSEEMSDNICYATNNQQFVENKIKFCQPEKKVELKQKFGKEEKVELTSAQHKSLLTQMTGDEFDYWVEQIELQIGKEGEQQFRQKNKSDYHVITYWKQYRKEIGKSIPKFARNNFEKENIDFSHRAEKYLKSQYFTLIVLPSYVEFVPKNGSSKVESISYDHKDFKQQITHMLTKKEFKKI